MTNLGLPLCLMPSITSVYVKATLSNREEVSLSFASCLDCNRGILRKQIHLACLSCLMQNSYNKSLSNNRCLVFEKRIQKDKNSFLNVLPRSGQRRGGVTPSRTPKAGAV